MNLKLCKIGVYGVNTVRSRRYKYNNNNEMSMVLVIMGLNFLLSSNLILRPKSKNAIAKKYHICFAIITPLYNSSE